MKKHTNKSSAKKSRRFGVLRKPNTLLGLCASLAAASSAYGQAAPSTPETEKKDDAITLEKVVVTGSYIPQAIDAVAQPVALVTSVEIEKSGVHTNALDVLKKTIPQLQGNANIGSNNANISSNSTGGGSQASLRNLTTLTLINGRRAAASPITGTGGNQFVDLNILPIAAIDSIEVLLDGASATYGSDATSGVINIKTKRDFNGTNLAGYYEFSDQKGKWATFGGNFVTGASSANSHITIAGGWSHEDPLFQFERPYSSPQYGTPTFGGVINFGGNYFVLNPTLAAPPVNETKPTVTVRNVWNNGVATNVLLNNPTTSSGTPYFGAVGSNAVYWGAFKTASGNLYKNGEGETASGFTGFGAGELAGASSPEAEKVAFDLSKYVTILQQRDSFGTAVSFDHKFNDAAEFFGDVLASQIKTISQINAQPIGTVSSFNVTGDLAGNPFIVDSRNNTNSIPSTVTRTLRVRNRFTTNPREYRYDTTFVRLVAGFRGRINDRLSYETAVNLNNSDLAYRNHGVVDSAKLLAAAGISSGSSPSFNIFERNVAPSVVAASNFIGTAYNDFTSGLRSWDARLTYRAFELPGGDLTIAGGTEIRRETLTGSADLNSVPDEYGNIGWTGATSVNPFSATRDVQGYFVEAGIPLVGAKQNIKGIHTLDFDVAGRYEKYSDTDDPVVPKVTFRWLPFNDEFAFRGTWGKSFNAPTLYQLVGPSDVGFTPEVTLLPYGAADDPDNYVSGQAQIRGGSNPNLKPARSTSYTAGVVWSPKALKGFSTELTYWNVREKDVVGVISSQTILQSLEDLGGASPYLAENAGPNNTAGNFINPKTGKSVYDARIEGFRQDGAAITEPGLIASQLDSIYIERPLVNIGAQNASGFDLTTRYKFETAKLGSFDNSLNVAYWMNYQFDGERLDGAATVTGGTIPRYTINLQNSWTKGSWDAFLTSHYIPKTDAPDEQSGKTAAESYATFDVGIGYRFRHTSFKVLDGLRVSLVVKNLGNEKPPQLPDTFSNDSVDTGAYDPIGRTFVMSCEYKF